MKTFDHNATTGEIIERDLTEQELAQIEIDKTNETKRLEAVAKAEADRASAQAKLAALGLTADDLKALGL